MNKIQLIRRVAAGMIRTFGKWRRVETQQLGVVVISRSICFSLRMDKQERAREGKRKKE